MPFDKFGKYTFPDEKAAEPEKPAKQPAAKKAAPKPKAEPKVTVGDFVVEDDVPEPVVEDQPEPEAKVVYDHDHRYGPTKTVHDMYKSG